jgi:hypothetical protein
MEQLSIPIFLTGLGLAALGLLWLIIVAFRRRFLWGVVCLLAALGLVAVAALVQADRELRQPITYGVAGGLGLVLLLFVLVHGRGARLPLAVVLLGLAVGAFPAAYSRLVPIDLGPREKLVDGEMHITLTGWDRDDYSFLRDKPDVVVLQMANADVTDDTLQYLKGLEKLRELDLNDTQVTDEGLLILKELPALEALRLKGTKITDAGFREHLLPGASLRMLDLRGTGVSREAVKTWRAAKPGRRVLQ